MLSLKRCSLQLQRWRFTFYMYMFTYGVRLLKQSPWWWNTRQCWIGYPLQPLTPELHYYYIIQLSFYWSLMFSQFIDIKRKDFAIMFTHHIVTVTLLTFSYTVNFTRVGALTLCLHDSVDIVLEAAKLTNYCKCQRLCDILFLMFAIIFIITRLGIYPLWILNTTLFELPAVIGTFPSWSIFIILLLVLQVLHYFWTYLIVKAAYKAFSKGKARDDRSDVESSSDEEPSPHSKTSHSSATTNGTSGANGTNGYLTGGSSAEEH
ncbi:ceramide synthase 6 isoform X2 [Sphaerodactylus townsendi]|uniref:ceramide synthase 6 isoform X2 n=1 Tax=Sphaerodactylus townsendi TaxID=933632 RepID=UPI00202625EC|nr:ceramide synthase 6 isoform X2 [Sphaerodactylus townsendi]